MSTDTPAPPERSRSLSPTSARPERSRRAPFEPRPFGHFPQPLAEPGVQHPQQFQDEDDEDAFSAWLRHVEAERIG